jgi:hypothetical protein
MTTAKKQRDVTVWLEGSGIPSVSLGVNDDWYLDTDNGKKYQKVTGIWILAGGIGHIIEEDGLPVTPREALNFNGFALTDDAPNDATVITALSTMTGAVDVPMVSPKESFTPAFAGMTNITWTGQKSRVGNLLCLEMRGVLTGTPVGTDLTLTLPDSLSFDNAVSDSSSFNSGIVADVVFSDEIVDATRRGSLMVTSATTLQVTTGTIPIAVTDAVPFTWAVDDEIYIYCLIPILGWDAQRTINIGAIPALFMGVASAASYALTTGSDQALVFDSEDRDDNKMIDLGVSTVRVYIPLGCDTAMVTGILENDYGSAGSLVGSLYLNGTKVAQADSALATPKVSVPWNGDVSEGDYFELTYNQANASNILGSLTVMAWNSNSPSTSQHTFIIGASDELGPLYTIVGATSFRMPHKFFLTEVRASASVAPSGAEIIVDVKVNGTSIFTTNLLSIDADEKSSLTALVPPNLTTAQLVDDDEVTVDITQVGSGNAGAGLKIYLIGY